MPSTFLALDLAPDPVALARALEGRPGLALLHAGASGHLPPRSYVAADPVEVAHALVPPACPRDDDPRTRHAPRWIGALPYEAARGRERAAWTRHPDLRPQPHVAEPRWHRYDAVACVDHEAATVGVVGDDPRAVEALAAALAAGARPPGLARVTLVDDEPAAAHLERVRAAQALIAAGDLYQVNLARRLRVRVAGAPLDLYARFAAASPAAFGAYLDLDGVHVLSTSPELFLAVDPDGHVVTAPIKGTRPRGVDAADDARRAAELDADPKERAELAMIVDVERNDLGRVARTGSVRLARGPSIEVHPHVLHRVAVVEAELADGRTLDDLLAAMLPSGSVTGAPKTRAMEVIATLEPVRRGLYTGAFGAVGRDGSLRLAMAIRVLTVRGDEGHYFAGGGIVADSDPARELDETTWKAAQLAALA